MSLLSKTFSRRRNRETVSAPPAPAEDKAFSAYIRDYVLPVPAAVRDNYVPSRLMGSAGIELNEAGQLARLKQWRGDAYQQLYRTLRNDEQINCSFNGKSYLGSSCLHNGWYPTPDAEIYASMIYDFRPDQIVEVGSGFSTLIARRALKYAGLEAPLRVIDPAPRTDIEQAADSVVYARVEEARLERMGLTGRSMLFIDSSHITRVRGDVPYLYCEVLPKLPAGTVVHVHDIFIPYDYPSTYDHLAWTEQYVLHALLADSNRYQTLMATQFLSRRHAREMQATFGPQTGADDLFYGASYWFQVR